VDRTVAHLNIEHYKRLLAMETDENKRKMLKNLLAEEEAKLARVQREDNCRGPSRSTSGRD
jgi:hypothetical protein